MTRQARGAQTSMIFRVFRVWVESKIPDRLDAQSIPPPLSLPAVPVAAPSPRPLFLVDIDTSERYTLSAMHI